MKRQLLLKLVVSVVALALAVVTASDQWPSLKITGEVLGLLALAVVPWLGALLESAELPGGWKVQFRKMRREQEQQRSEIESLKFLLSGFITPAELTHLRKLHKRDSFPFLPGPETHFFLEELRRLRALGLIDNVPDRGIRALARDGGDVGSYFFITPVGADYLRLREKVTTPVD